MSERSATVQAELSLHQIAEALRQLPEGDKLALWRLLDAEINRAAIEQRLAEALRIIRTAYAAVSEDEAMSDALQAVREVRGQRYSDPNRS
jgi:Mg/Co/Ni transporter MgtE